MRGFDAIPANRKTKLEKLSEYIQHKQDSGSVSHLVYICTHNSRRSHLGQLWAQVAAAYFGVKNIRTYSGGTQTTAFHPNAIHALEQAGFRLEKLSEGSNPHYHVYYSATEEPVECFSKVYDHPRNPSSGFVSVMMCSDAEENCPFIPGVELRVATTYEDPKSSDGTQQQETVYSERCKQIALETFYVFSQLERN